MLIADTKFCKECCFLCFNKSNKKHVFPCENKIPELWFLFWEKRTNKFTNWSVFLINFLLYWYACYAHCIINKRGLLSGLSFKGILISCLWMFFCHSFKGVLILCLHINRNLIWKKDWIWLLKKVGSLVCGGHASAACGQWGGVVGSLWALHGG